MQNTRGLLLRRTRVRPESEKQQSESTETQHCAHVGCATCLRASAQSARNRRHTCTHLNEKLHDLTTMPPSTRSAPCIAFRPPLPLRPRPPRFCPLPRLPSPRCPPSLLALLLPWRRWTSLTVCASRAPGPHALPGTPKGLPPAAMLLDFSGAASASSMPCNGPRVSPKRSKDAALALARRVCDMNLCNPDAPPAARILVPGVRLLSALEA